MRRVVVVLIASALAGYALLVAKTGGKPAIAPVASVVRSGDKVTSTGPKIALTHGIVQVRVTITDGKITDVAALSLPHDNPDSWNYSSAAAVRLRSEVLAKQSANIDVVSGATFTSHGYAHSLQAALDAVAHS